MKYECMLRGKEGACSCDFADRQKYVLQAMRHTLYGKNRRTFLTHGGDWYERIREYFREHHVVPD